MRIRAKKILSILLALVLVLQFVPFQNASAVTVSDNSETLQNLDSATPATKYVTTSVNNVSISSAGTPITPIGNVYSNVPANATLAMDVDFSLSDGVQAQALTYTYAGGDYFTVALPEGMTFSSATGTIQANHNGLYIYDIARYVISGDIMTVYLTDGNTGINLDSTTHGGAANVDHLGKHATIHIEGTFNSLHAGDSEQTVFTIGSQTITINRVPLPTDFLIDKSYLGYDASTNELRWQIVVRPPVDYPSLPFNGLTISDTLTGNHAFVETSFELNSTTISPTINGAVAIYTFPSDVSDITGAQTLTYKTTPTAFSSAANASSTYGNTAALKNGITTLISDSASTILSWITKTGVKQPGDVIKWTVNIIVPGDSGKAVSGAQIIDTIPTDLAFIDDNPGSYPVTVKYGSGAAQTVTAGTAVFAGSTLTYTFPDDAQPTAGTTVSLSFYTKIDPTKLNDYLSSNTATSFSNSASFDWAENPSASNPTAASSAVSVIGGGGILTKVAVPSSQTYAYITDDYGTTKWVITVNSNNASLSNAILTDAVQSGHQLIIDTNHQFEVKQADTSVFATDSPSTSANFTYTDSANFTYNFGNITSAYTVTYYTRVNDTGKTRLYANGSASFQNNSTLSYNNGAVATSNATKTYNLQMLSKTAGDYDYNTKLTKWTLTVNRNRLPLSGAIITDTLPAGMSVYTDVDHDFKVTTNDSDTASTLGDAGITNTSTANGFTLTLPVLTTDKYTITFYTELSETALKAGLPWLNDQKTFTNSASLSATGIGSAISASADVTVRNPVIKKTALYTSGSDIIDWTATLNNDRLTLANGFVTDTMTGDVQFEPDSVKLWFVDINSSTGAPDSNTKTEVTKSLTSNPTNNEFAFSVVGNVLTVYLPTNTDRAYILEYRTHALSGNITVSNSIVLSDTDSIASNIATNVNVSAITSIGGSYSNSITVHKESTQGTALEGAVFQLFTASGVALKRNNVNITRTTNSNGDAVFESLPSWSFIVREITPPPGYLIDTPDTTVTSLTGTQTVNVTNTLVQASISISKTGAGGTNLSGGEFKLSGVPAAGGQFEQTVESVNGTISFTNVPLGSNYTIAELTAPVGHVLSSTTLTARVELNAAKTGYTVSVTPNATLTNVPETTSVSFIKTDLNASPLSDGSFSLTGTDYTGAAVSKASTNVGGTVSFADVTIGEYTITEDTPPAGYLMPTDPDILEVTVSYNETNTGLTVALTAGEVPANSYANAPAVGTISFNKVDSDSEVPVVGGIFRLTGKDYANRDVQRDSYSINGVVTFSALPVVLQDTHYTITELTPPPGYLSTDETLTATVILSQDGTHVLTAISAAELVNERAPLTTLYAQIIVLKTDEKGTALSGAEFTLYDKNGKAAAMARSDTNGLAVFEMVKVDIGYTIKETKAPVDYELNPSVIAVTMSGTQALTYTVINKKLLEKPGSIHILKTDESGAPLSGAEFTLYDEDYNALEKVITQQNGIVVFASIPVGSYTVSETRAPLGYTAQTGSTAVMVESAQTVSLTFVNKKDIMATGGLQILKVDKDNQPLSGAEFTLYDQNGNALAKATSDSNGIALFEGLAPGSYSVKETVAPSGYALFSAPLSVEVQTTGTALSYKLRNDLLLDDAADVAGWSDFDDDDETLPQTGGTASTFYMLLAGLASLLSGLVLLMHPKKKRNAQLPNNR